MAWVNSCPTLLVPVSLATPAVAVCHVPHTPLLAVVSATSVVIYHAPTLLPLALHKRTPECLQSHGNSVQAHVRHVSTDTCRQDRLHLANVYVQTNSHYVLIYHVFVNYNRSLYEVTDSGDGDRLLQNGLPLASDASRFNFVNLLKSATKSIIQGGADNTNLTNLEHFKNAPLDDDLRNENVPLVKLSVVKVLKMNAAILGLWCKVNSQTLIFANDCHEVQVLNLKTLHTEIVRLLDCKWYFDTVLIEYNLTHNYFLHVSSTGEVGVLQFEHSDLLTVQYTLVGRLDFPCRSVLFNPQYNLVVVQSDSDLRIYSILAGKVPSWSYIKTIRECSATRYKWAPCGTFLVVWSTESHHWAMVSRFGFVLFDSRALCDEMAVADLDPATLERLSGFCYAADCAVGLNSQVLYILGHTSHQLYYIDLLRLQERFSAISMFYSESYLSMPVDTGFARFPVLPMFQRLLANFHYLNGPALAHAHRKPTAVLTLRASKSLQLSMSHGSSLAISTPVRLGSDFSHPLWYVFYNHVAEPLNIVDHFWVEDYLVLVNRFARDDYDPDDPDAMNDELMIYNTAASKYGTGGVAYKFDSDMLVWRHSFKNKIINYELVDRPEAKTLVLVTNDMKIIMMEITEEQAHPAASRISIRVRRTIHLSSIKHSLPIWAIQQMTMVDDRHFFFLLSTGDLFLLKNQVHHRESEVEERGTTHVSNMYDLIKISSAVESFQVNFIDFSHTRHNRYITLFNGAEVLIYNMNELVERVYDFEGVDHHVATESPLRPIRIQIAAFMPLKLVQSSGSIEVSGIEYQTLVKSGFLILKHRSSRQLILNKFIQHDLFETSMSVEDITRKYANFGNYDYCLELLLFENLDTIGHTDRLAKVCLLVDATPSSDSIYINFLRKIEVKYWDHFFRLLNQTPVGFMNRLRESKNVELCYNYLNVYLNFKREYESAASPVPDDSATILDVKDKALITQIIQMLLAEQKWDQCFELCRYIKLLEPSGDLLRDIRRLMV